MTVAESVEWRVLPFSKYKGKTLPQVAWMDPGWILWAMKKRIFKTQDLIEQVIHIKRLMSHIRIPDKDGLRQKMIVWIDHNRCIRDLDIVSMDGAKPYNSHMGVKVMDRIDLVHMAYTCRTKKTPVQRLIKKMKEALFGNGSQAMTRSRCDAFYNDLSNFKLEGDENE